MVRCLAGVEEPASTGALVNRAFSLQVGEVFVGEVLVCAPIDREVGLDLLWRCMPVVHWFCVEESLD